jgi:hypothetical protein
MYRRNCKKDKAVFVKECANMKCGVERLPHIATLPESICEHCPLSYKYEVKIMSFCKRK